MGFWIWAAVYVGSTLLSYLLRVKPTSSVHKGSLQDFDIPTIEEGKALPVVYGTCHIQSPAVVWYGDLKTEPITDGGVTVGYRYYLGAQYALCSGPVDELLEFRIDNRRCAWYKANTFLDHVRYSIDLQTFSGGSPDRHMWGRGAAGGIRGDLDFYYGRPDQQPNDYLEAAFESAVPGYRGVCHAIQRQMYVGDDPYLRPPSFVVRSCPNELGLDGGHHRIGDDANPACIIYAELTRPSVPSGGAGLSPSDIDVESLMSIGETLYAEGMGLSLLFEGKTPLERIDEVLRHVDGVRYWEPTTGLLTFRLIRDDYDPDEIPVFGPGTLQEFEHDHGDLSGTKNVVRVRYTDRAAGLVQRVASAQDLGNIDARGGVMDPADIELLGFSTAANAQKMAARSLRSLSMDLVPVSGIVDRSGYQLRPGSVVRIDWPPEGISGLIIRVSRVALGTLQDGQVRFDGVQDVFATDWTAYSAPPETGWLPPVEPVEPLDAQLVIPAPKTLYNYDSPDWPEQAVGLCLAARGPGLTDGYLAQVEDASGAFVNVGRFGALTPRGTLAAAVTETTGSLQVRMTHDAGAIRSVSEAEFRVGRNLLLLDDELIAYRDVSDNGDGTATLSTVARGCVDTMPAAHALDAVIWFVTHGASFVPLLAPPAGETRNNHVRLLPYNSLGDLDAEEATTSEIPISLPLRAARPFCPADIRINLARYPSTITGALSVWWWHRNRLVGWNYHNAGITQNQEAGVTYTIRVYGETGVLIHTEAGITGYYWYYAPALEIEESGLGRLNTSLRVVLETWREDVQSWQTFEWDVGRV